MLQNNDEKCGSLRRREFIITLTKVTGGTALLCSPFLGKASFFDAPVTVGDIMDMFIKQVPGAPFTTTVDTLKSGSRDTVVTGVVTTMFATIDVIRKAITADANFIIAHEPTFYNHEDKTDWLQGDDVYEYKRNLLQQHNIAVWRNHDYIHSLKPDGVGEGVLAQLGWKSYYDGNEDAMLTIPSVSLSSLISHLKKKLLIKEVRYIGDLTQTCQKVLLLPGAAGGKTQVTMMSKSKPDVLICGELSEWETAEYVRDARAKGDPLSLVVLGHIASEEPGSEWMLGWLKQHVPGVPAMHIPAGNSLSFM